MTALPSSRAASQSQIFRVLYVGPEPGPVEQILSRVESAVGLRVVTGVAEAMKLARTTPVDCVIIDQRRESNHAALLTAALAGENNIRKIVVLTSPENAAAYEALGSKCQVLYYPVKPIDMLDAVFVAEKSKRSSTEWQTLIKEKLLFLRELKRPELNVSFSFSRTMIPLVSIIYKNTALVLLAALFSVFLSYGVMIVFFLISTNWGAPLTLSEGHELVIKAERQISDLKVKRNLIKQRISKEQNETVQAKRTFEDAKILANLVASTIDSEIEQRLILQKDVKDEVARLVVLLKQMKRATGKAGFRKELGDKFKKRLINRQVYNSSLLAMLELQQRNAGVQSQIATQRRQTENIRQSIIMLESMRQQIQLPEIKMITAANAEFVPLANQVVVVKSELLNAKSKLASHQERLSLLVENDQIVAKSISGITETPMARAAKKPVIVLFVPYENGAGFKPDKPLYSCSFGVIWCTKVGFTGKPVEGEAVSVHPFFGKNIRGSFVEAVLTDPEAAKKEVLHVGRPPLFF